MMSPQRRRSRHSVNISKLAFFGLLMKLLFSHFMYSGSGPCSDKATLKICDDDDDDYVLGG